MNLTKLFFFKERFVVPQRDKFYLRKMKLQRIVCRKRDQQPSGKELGQRITMIIKEQ